MSKAVIRRAMAGDMPACAAILNRWIDEADWMPRCHPPTDVQRHYCTYMRANRVVIVAEHGGLIVGFLARDGQTITAFYVAATWRGAGIGSALLEKARTGQARLDLWTFQANASVRRFYAKQGFREVRRTDGDNEENLADMLLEWRRETV
ncbi:GNAT family N-acetyltransferase [Paracoccus sp. (in: a-proteobacteria)]|uniref:GNAT family N-acetyltransferase n=1 Tax=Paracoccus sp. TaxID=267 RepID=UPI003A853CA9